MCMIARLAGSDGRTRDVPPMWSEVERRRAGQTDANENRLHSVARDERWKMGEINPIFGANAIDL